MKRKKPKDHLYECWFNDNLVVFMRFTNEEVRWIEKAQSLLADEGRMKHYIDEYGRLVFTVVRQERRLLKKLKREDESRFHTDSFLHDWFEALVANTEYEWVDPSETGDLTSAPMLGIRDEVGNVVHRWAFMDYAIVSVQERLMDEGKTVWEGG